MVYVLEEGFAIAVFVLVIGASLYAAAALLTLGSAAMRATLAAVQRGIEVLRRGETPVVASLSWPRVSGEELTSVLQPPLAACESLPETHSQVGM